MMQEKIKKLFLSRIERTLSDLGKVGRKETHNILQACYSSAIGICEELYGRNSLQLQDLQERAKKLREVSPHAGSMDEEIALVIKGTLDNAQTEIEEGVITSIYRQAVGSVIVDFISLADTALQEDQKDVAAVLAAAALEDAMKSKAEELGIETEGRDLSDIISALKSVSFLGGPQAKVVSSYIPFRNKALHAEWEKILKPEVAGLIAFLKQFAVEAFQ